MASRKKRPPPRRPPGRPSNWFLQLGRDKARARALERVRQGMLSAEDVPAYVNAAALRARLSNREYLSRSVKDLRRYFAGFEAKHGYDLNRVHEWTKQRADQVRRYGEYLHNLQSRPYVDVAPKRYKGARRQQFKKKLRYATGQGSPRQTRYLFHVDQTERPTEVLLTRRGQLEVREPLKKTYVTRQFWYFRDYARGRQPQTFAQILAAARRMLKDMPDHLWFSLFSVPHGVISVPVQKDFILQTLQRYHDEYGNALHAGFAETLLGFTFAGTREQAMRDYQNRLSERMRHQRTKSEAALVKRRRLSFQQRMGRIR